MANGPLHSDIRSPSVPRLRFHTQRAKYGGPPPTPTGLPHTAAFPGLTFQAPTGSFVPSPRHLPPQAPSKHLTKAQLYRVAQKNVPSLIGKHVNRHNQRTGGRDPWKYYGPGRRWSKAVASGKVETRDRERWMDVEMGNWDATFNDWCGSELCERCRWWPGGGEGEVEVEADEVWGQKYGYGGEGLRVLENRRRGKGRRRGSDGDWRVVRREDVEARWTERGRGDTATEEGEGKKDGDEWEIVSVNSAPG